ncbi:MAG: hypothetical protein HUJ26_23470 [Planctomycetaceae bacterium]|nr:hypothetical protein [Planctomycetaceae bacterium]
MKHDTKVGLGLGILLVGITCAFYFRDQPLDRSPLPELESTVELEERLSQSVAERRHHPSSLDEFEQNYREDLQLDDVELEKELPQIDSAPQPSSAVAKNSIEVDDQGREETPIVILKEPKPIPGFDPDFDFLNEPSEAFATLPKDDPIVTQARPERTSESTASATKKSNSTKDSPAHGLETQPVVQSTKPPSELPAEVEMFSEDLAVRDETDENEIPVKLDPITIDPTPLKASSDQASELVSRPEPQSQNEDRSLSRPAPDNEPVRDPRVIVPKRVRLNEPVARHTSDSLITNPATPKADRVAPKRSTNQPEPISPARIPEELPSLDGLEPLDPQG